MTGLSLPSPCRGAAVGGVANPLHTRRRGIFFVPSGSLGYIYRFLIRLPCPDPSTGSGSGAGFWRISGMIPQRELFFCLLSGRRIVRRADRNVCPTFTPPSSECARTCDGSRFPDDSAAHILVLPFQLRLSTVKPPLEFWRIGGMFRLCPT